MGSCTASTKDAGVNRGCHIFDTPVMVTAVRVRVDQLSYNIDGVRNATKGLSERHSGMSRGDDDDVTAAYVDIDARFL